MTLFIRLYNQKSGSFDWKYNLQMWSYVIFIVLRITPLNEFLSIKTINNRSSWRTITLYSYLISSIFLIKKLFHCAKLPWLKGTV